MMFARWRALNEYVIVKSLSETLAKVEVPCGLPVDFHQRVSEREALKAAAARMQGV